VTALSFLRPGSLARTRTIRALISACTVLSAVAVWSCANAGAPPGGPPDTAPPVLLSITPANGAIGAKPNNVELKFNEVVSEQPRGASDLRQLVFISPRAIDASVDWHRDRVTIHPKGGWKPNTVYSVQISGGIQDLRNNSIDTSVSVVFSTGGPIPNTTINGVSFDWPAGRPAAKALVEALAVRGKDTTIYQVLADSAGRFALKYAPPGDYLVRTIIDRNNNRLLDPTEGFDTIRVALTERADVEFYAFPHDTVGLRVSDVQAQPQDSLRVVKISFDKPLAPDQLFTNPQFVFKRADSTNIGVALVQTALQRAVIDSVRRKAVNDSIAKANTDTTPAGRARADSALRKKRADSVAAIDLAVREARRLAAQRGQRLPVAPRDTTPPPKMKRPVVSSDVYVTLEEPLKSGTAYHLQVNTVRSLSGTIRSPARGFVTPREAKKDSTAAPTRRPP
jgi:hypothetical protein